MFTYVITLVVVLVLYVKIVGFFKIVHENIGKRKDMEDRGVLVTRRKTTILKQNKDFKEWLL